MVLLKESSTDGVVDCKIGMLIYAFLSPQDQFEFALTAVAEEVNAILKALPQ